MVALDLRTLTGSAKRREHDGFIRRRLCYGVLSTAFRTAPTRPCNLTLCTARPPTFLRYPSVPRNPAPRRTLLVKVASLALLPEPDSMMPPGRSEPTDSA